MTVDNFSNYRGFSRAPYRGFGRAIHGVSVARGTGFQSRGVSGFQSRKLPGKPLLARDSKTVTRARVLTFFNLLTKRPREAAQA